MLDNQTAAAALLAGVLTAGLPAHATTNNFVCDGRMVVTQAMEAASLLMTPGSTLELADQDLVLGGDIRGSEYTVEFRGTNGALAFSAPATWTGAIRGTGNPTLRVDGANLVFNGQWFGADSDRVKNRIELSNNATFYVGPDAILDHQLPDQVRTGRFLVDGSNGGSFELDPGFVADHGDFPDPDIWRARGFSVVYLSNAALVTHATESLPSIHKRTVEGYHSHHGVISFWGGTNNLWHVRSNRQVYDGALWWRNRTEIRTEQDLILIGRLNRGSRCYLGTEYTATGHTLVKSGPARMEVYASQAYAAGTTLDIQQGTVSFHTDPASSQGYLVAANSPLAGTNLIVHVAAEGRLRSQAPRGCGLHSLTCEGILEPTTPLRAIGPITFTPGSTMQVAPDALSRTHPLLRSQQQITGDVRLTLSAAPRPGVYLLADAPTVDLRLTAGAMPGLNIRQQGSDLVIEAAAAVTETPVLP